jgi:hypothetical protein
MNRFVSLRPAAFLLVAVAVLALPDRGSAGERPHRSRGTAQFVPGTTDFVGTGNATHLGRYAEVGSVTFLPSADPTAVPIVAWAIYTAANGDELYATFDGHLNALTGAITATVTYEGGTGRFDDASGSATFLGQILPDGTLSVVVEGVIDY